MRYLELIAETSVALPSTLYHGTFAQRVPSILQHGLNKGAARNFDISHAVVYLADQPDVAERYARMAAEQYQIDDDITVLTVDPKQLDPTLLHVDENDAGDMIDDVTYADGAQADYQSYEYHGIIPASALTIDYTI